MATDPYILQLSELADIARTLGHAHRLLLLDHIAQGERSVERLAELTQLSVANTSQHLQHLRRGGFVESRRDGKRVLYRLGGGPIEAILAALRGYAAHGQAEIRELIADPRNGEHTAISRDELLELLRSGAVTLLDVRPAEEYALGHLPGALNVPTGELAERLAELPPGQEVVAYCRGPYCILSKTAEKLLTDHGFQVRRLVAGFPDWKAAGLAVEV